MSAAAREHARIDTLDRPRTPTNARHHRHRLCFSSLVLVLALATHLPSAGGAVAASAVATGVARRLADRPTDPAAALEAYIARAAALRDQAMHAGAIDYQDVIEAAYGPAMIDDDVIQAKARWRASVGGKFEFVADYSTIHGTAAAVEPLVAVPDPRLRSTLVAQYEATSHTIGISGEASDFAIFHEAGHALQRVALEARGSAAGSRAHEPESLLERLLRAGAPDATTARRLRYLCSQTEFEVRLQDLNRFYATLVAGHPIMNPADSVRALAALGLPLTFDEAREAFAAGGLELSRQDFDAYVSTPTLTDTAVAEAFEDARELFLVRRFALRLDRACWDRMLAKTIFEAPGHL